MTYYNILYTGAFAYIKPWTAVRDALTYSQQFLSPSTISGINQKLFGLGANNHILRHRLQYQEMDTQQEQTRGKMRKIVKENGVLKEDDKGILNRGVLLNPRLYLAFDSQESAQSALKQHICLCRNEDVLFADFEYGIKQLSEQDFDQIEGFELRYNLEDPTQAEAGAFPVGRHRYIEGNPMTYGTLVFNDAF